ncbi:MAG TPA: phosphoribosylanthranilate isomerase [Acidimicrobiales bacterium]
MRFVVEGLFVKISGITSEEDALFSVALGANAVGFDFALGERQIDVNLAHDIVRRLPAGVLTVGTFRNEMPQRVAEVANTIGLTAVQIEGAISGDELSYVTQRVNTVIRTVPPGVEKLALWQGVDYLALPELDERRALQDSVEQLSSTSARLPLIASGGLTPTNVVEVVQRLGVFGVEARSGVENEPGKKDPVKLGEFIANARWAHDHSLVERPYNEWSL